MNILDTLVSSETHYEIWHQRKYMDSPVRVYGTPNYRIKASAFLHARDLTERAANSPLPYDTTDPHWVVEVKTTRTVKIAIQD